MKYLRSCNLCGIRPTGLRRWNSAVSVTVCQKVVSEQPAVLLLAGGDPRVFKSWEARFRLGIKNGKSSNPCILPFVNRVNTVTDMTNTIVDNLEKAKEIKYNQSHVMKRYLRLVGSGAVFGAGKTRIAGVLHKCLEGVLGRKLIYATSEIDVKKSTYIMWLEDICSKAGMEGLAAAINKEMTMTQLVQATEKYLADRGIMMFLHLDEFAPFTDGGRTSNTPDNFYQCWRRMLMPILCSPSIGLYISGRVSYFDTIGRGQSGQSPSSALSVQLDLFTTDTIYTILSKIFIPLNATEETTVSLSTALDQLFSSGPGQTPPLKGFWSRDVAQRVHEVTGGVPRFVQHALHALLMNTAMHSALFEYDGSVHDAALLDKFFSRGGDVYDSVSEAAAVHFDSIGAACTLEKERVKKLSGLLQLLFLKDRTFSISPDDIANLSSARFSLDERPITQLVSCAQFWGIHRTIDRDRECISFAVPSAVLDGLARALPDWTMIMPGLEDDDLHDPHGDKAALKVHAALTFHCLVAALLPHTNWLGLVEDSKYSEGSAVTLPQHPAATAISEPETLSSRWWVLPRLPVINGKGRLQDIDSVRRSIATRQGKPPKATKGDSKRSPSKCRPELLGRFLNSLSDTEFHAFSTGPRSSSADFIVRYGKEVSHLQVRSVDLLSLQTVLEECTKVAPTAQASPELQHTLIFIIEKSAVRTQAKSMIEQPTFVDQLHRKAEELEARKLDEQGMGKMLQAVSLIRNGALNVVVLDDCQYKRFLRYRELAKHLLVRREE